MIYISVSATTNLHHHIVPSARRLQAFLSSARVELGGNTSETFGAIFCLLDGIIQFLFDPSELLLEPHMINIIRVRKVRNMDVRCPSHLCAMGLICVHNRHGMVLIAIKCTSPIQVSHDRHLVSGVKNV